MFTLYEVYLRRYQSAAVDAFHCGGANKGGNGVVVLPCGAGKTAEFRAGRLPV